VTQNFGCRRWGTELCVGEERKKCSAEKAGFAGGSAEEFCSCVPDAGLGAG